MLKLISISMFETIFKKIITYKFDHVWCMMLIVFMFDIKFLYIVGAARFLLLIIFILEKSLFFFGTGKCFPQQIFPRIILRTIDNVFIFCHLHRRPRTCYFTSLCATVLVYKIVPSDVRFSSFLLLCFSRDALIFGTDTIPQAWRALALQSLRMLSRKYQGSLRARKLRHPQRVTHIQGMDSWGKCKWWPSKLAVSFDLPEHHFWDIYFSYHFNISYAHSYISVYTRNTFFRTLRIIFYQ